MRNAYRRGAAQGYRDAEPPDASDPGWGADALGGGAQPEPPGWARDLARRQRLTQAGLVAAGAMREGDRPAAGSGPDLKDKN
jgi:type IV secretion system protein TrbL